MRVALIDVKGNDSRTIDKNSSMNIRNMVLLSKYLGADFFYNAHQLSTRNNDYDVLVFGFGGMSANIEQVRQFVNKEKNRRIFWFITEYDSPKNPSLYYVCKDLSLGYAAIQNMQTDAMKDKRCIKRYMLNLNLLIAREQNALTEKRYDCVYYSRWRKDRKKYLKVYLQGDIYFSSDSKNFKKHKHIGCKPKYIKKLSWEQGKETLNNFRYSLYIEDEYTHNVFNNLANRWYEAGFCNNVMFFDVNCWNTIRKSEIAQYENQIKDYIVSTHKELLDKIEYCNKDFMYHLNIQKSWRKDELRLREKMLQELKDIVYQKLTPQVFKY